MQKHGVEPTTNNYNITKQKHGKTVSYTVLSLRHCAVATILVWEDHFLYPLITMLI